MQKKQFGNPVPKLIEDDKVFNEEDEKFFNWSISEKTLNEIDEIEKSIRNSEKKHGNIFFG